MFCVKFFEEGLCCFLPFFWILCAVFQRSVWNTAVTHFGVSNYSLITIIFTAVWKLNREEIG